MSQYEFAVIDEVESLPFVVSVTGMAAAEKGFEAADDIQSDHKFPAKKFLTEFNDDLSSASEEYPVVYDVVLTPPEGSSQSMSEMVNAIDAVITDYVPHVCIGSVDSGVPADDWSGWEVDPVIEVLCVKACT